MIDPVAIFLAGPLRGWNGSSSARLFSLATFEIQYADRNDALVITGKLFSWGDDLSFQDLAGATLATADPRRQATTARPRRHGEAGMLRTAMVNLTIEMPEEAISALRETPERFAEELRFAAAAQWYHQGRMSGSKAAQVAGMTRLEFLDELARRKLDVIKVDFDRLREEIGAA